MASVPAQTSVSSPPPCGEGLGVGVPAREGGTAAPDRTTPTPGPSPQGGGEQTEFTARSRTTASPPKVELRDVALRYFGRDGETEALRGISLTIAAGEFVAII